MIKSMMGISPEQLETCRTCRSIGELQQRGATYFVRAADPSKCTSCFTEPHETAAAAAAQWKELCTA